MAPTPHCFRARRTPPAFDTARRSSARALWRAAAPSPTRVAVCGASKWSLGSYSVGWDAQAASSPSLLSSHITTLAGTRLPSRSLQAEPYTEEEVWGAVSTVELALEVCASRFTCAVPLAVVAADFGNHHALVRGSPVPKSQCPSLRGHSGESEPRTTSWTCQSAGVVVSASPASNADDSTLVQEVSAVPPEVSYAPIESL